MLQQTTAAAVAPRFERFVARWPTIEALAAAADADVLSEWAGLGYYARARNLIACARAVTERGGFPTTRNELRKMPGIGEYTSAAIAAIAFGERAAAVDTNAERVISRLHAIERPLRKDIERHVLAMIAEGEAGDVAQALMDLGATICRPKAPRCGDCPLRPQCAAFASGQPEAFPEPRPKRVRPHRCGIACWTERDGHVWLVRREPKGMLGGMAALPGGEWTEEGQAAPNAIGTVRHVFTHFVLDLDVVAMPEPVGEGWWHRVDQLAEAGLPTLYRRAAELALAVTREARAAA